MHFQVSLTDIITVIALVVGWWTAIRTGKQAKDAKTWQVVNEVVSTVQRYAATKTPLEREELAIEMLRKHFPNLPADQIVEMIRWAIQQRKQKAIESGLREPDAQ